MAKKINKDIKKKNSKKKFFRGLVYFLFLLSFITLGFLFFLDMIPTLYFISLAAFLIAFDLLMTYFLLGKGWKRRFFGTILSFLTFIVMSIVIFYSFNTLDFLNKITGKEYNTKNYSVIVLKNSQYEKLKELKDEDVGIVSNEDSIGIEEVKNYLNKKVKANYKSYEDSADLLEAFLKEDVEAILIEDAEKKILEEEHEDFLEKEKVIYTFSIDIKIEDGLAKEVDISKKPFNIFISGIDTYGKITSVSRSDVNMLISVNPLTHKILFTSIPRDYYVKLNSINTTYKDKLTHAGIHGIDKSVKTVEDLLETDVHYYAKVNFTSLVSVVDELGGIEVETDEAFRAYYVEDTVINYSFKKGTNKLNGRQALAYARERKSLKTGDVARTKHQQQILEAIIKKVLSKNIITKYDDLLKALEGKFVTNIGTKNITKLVRAQIQSMPSWKIEKYTLEGTGAMNYTYSYKKAKSYVMVPTILNEES